ncbi:RNA polymerase factor sigma-54 [Erythrobacter sanguineus]|uniref:RNA polymerase sigma-54 factor n=1 Tax=Erythrobacter sanguineus TaxID=198312 RepID=A0A1M7SFY4_9SPHN|nr:RNA polymerase factor sigma-54 [Erythrobacter sanguineus]SHN57393.1 RNA polymerase, sigma 54 subunit, RpoN/SigL [Erythrobacter sanguineus]
MALGPRLDLRQTQSLVMTPQLQQAIKLLAASNLEIESFIAEALDANPLLDTATPAPDEPERGEVAVALPEDAPADQLIALGGGEGDAPLDLASVDRDWDTGDGAARGARDAEWGAAASAGGDFAELPDWEQLRAAEVTLTEHLDAQIGTMASDPRTGFIARRIIGLLDDAGYLGTPIDEVADDLGVDLVEAEAALALVQSLDPSGVGARNLAECIAIQAREADRYDPCMAALIANLELVARGEVERLKRLCRVDDEDFADMLRELRSYDPKPGLAFAPSATSTVVPDILISANAAGGWDIALNEETLPRLIVNRGYFVELSGNAGDKAAQGWLKEKLADAHWLIRALDQRQKTILKTAAEIVRQQDGFFRRGVAELRPLTLREVAEKIEMHESTVSRVTSNKYLACARGTFELKYFFTSGVGSADGEGASSAAIKARIKALIDAETVKKILSDQQLADMLKQEGFDLARRTVAKYREAIGLGSSAERRRAKKLAGLR